MVAGKKQKSNFKNNAYDQIIMVKTYHHFKKADDMLKSIGQNLKPNGRVIVVEFTSDLNELNICAEIQSVSNIRQTWVQSNFKLLEEKVIGKAHFFSFEKQP